MKDLENICLSVEHDFDGKYQSVAPEIVQTSSFQFQNFAHYVHVNTDHEFAYTYTRGDNPTLEILEKKIAHLEGAEKKFCFRYGSYFWNNLKFSEKR